MYEFAGAGPCPFPGQLQYRVVNPRGAGVYFEKNFATPVGPALRPGSIVCGTPKTDPSGMSSYVVELNNGYASALDFEQLTSALPAPVLASGYYAGDAVPPMVMPPPTSPTVDCPPGMQWNALHGYCLPTATQPLPPPIHHAGYHAGWEGDEYGDEFAGAGPCQYPGQLQYRVVNPRGAGVFFEKNFATSVGPALRPGSIVCGTPRTDPSGMASYVVELNNGYANALDFEQLTSALPGPVLASGYDYAGEEMISSFEQTQRACPPGQRRDETGKCVPILPTPPIPIPLASGYFTGQAGDIQPDLYGADAIKKGCMPGTYWDGWYQRCVPVGRPIVKPPADPFPPTIEEWRKQHVTGGWDLFHDVFGKEDPFHSRREERGWERHEGREHEHHEPWHEHHEHEHRHWTGADTDEIVEIVGAAVSDGTLSADNAAVQADSAKLAALHPDAKGTTASDSAQAAAVHATQAASHAQAATMHPSPEGAVAHAQKANQHAQAAAAHAANAHAACGNFEAVGSYYTGAEAGGQHQHPAVTAAAHAENATKQASSARAAATHPTAQKSPVAHEAARQSGAHAEQAQRHAEAARAHPMARGAEHHAREAMRHTNAAAAHAIRAHGEARGRGFGRGREGFGRGREAFRGREGFRRGGFGGYRDAYGRFRGRRFHGEWRGFGHPGWRHGIAERWRHHRAECFQWGGWACLMERVYDPSGNMAYRVTPAGEMEGVELGPEQQQANVVYVQATGQQPPSNDDGPLPGSDQTSDGSKAPADEEDAGGDQAAAADQDAGAADAATDQAAATTTDTDDTAAAVANGGDATDATSGEFAGWQMQFTDPYGYFNMAAPGAWDSAYPYMPPDYPWYWW